MESKKYIGMDVHQASISAAVRDEAGKLVMECVIETKAGIILEFVRGLRGSLCITFEEGYQCRLVVRSGETRRRPGGGMRSAEERTAEGGQQE